MSLCGGRTIMMKTWNYHLKYQMKVPLRLYFLNWFSKWCNFSSARQNDASLINCINVAVYHIRGISESTPRYLMHGFWKNLKIFWQLPIENVSKYWWRTGIWTHVAKANTWCVSLFRWHLLMMVVDNVYVYSSLFNFC